MPADQPLRSALAAPASNPCSASRCDIAGRAVGILLLLDLPAPERLHEAVQIIMLLSPPIAIALRNTLAMEQIEKQRQEIQGYARELERRVEDRTVELAAANRDLSESRPRRSTSWKTPSKRATAPSR